MRWAVAILGFLLTLGIALTLWRRPAPTPGQQLAAALQKHGLILRTAIPLLDYTPPPTDSAGLQSGADSLNGGELMPVYNQRWIRAKNTEFVWQRVLGEKPADERLRKAIATDGRQKVRHALAEVVPDGDTVDAALKGALADLDHMTDQQLFSAWIAADQAVLVESDNWARAAREALLLTARVNTGPVIFFHTGVDDVYLLPLDGALTDHKSSDLLWTQMEAYDDGRLAWTAVMSMAGSAPPNAVREMAARMAAEVARSRPVFR